jgi:hypothetical protein
VIQDDNTALLNQMTEHLYEVLVFDKEGKVTQSIILTAFERDRILRIGNEK